MVVLVVVVVHILLAFVSDGGDGYRWNVWMMRGCVVIWVCGCETMRCAETDEWMRDEDEDDAGAKERKRPHTSTPVFLSLPLVPALSLRLTLLLARNSAMPTVNDTAVHFRLIESDADVAETGAVVIGEEGAFSEVAVRAVGEAVVV